MEPTSQITSYVGSSYFPYIFFPLGYLNLPYRRNRSLTPLQYKQKPVGPGWSVGRYEGLTRPLQFHINS